MFNSMNVMVIAIGVSLSLTALTGCKPAVSQQEKDAVVALKKLEAKVQTGINLSDYVAALGETTFAVNMLENGKDSKNQEVDDVIRSALADYKLSGDVWRLRIETTLNPRDATIRGAIRVTDAEAQNILSKIPSANKPITGELLEQRQMNDLVQAKITLHVAAPGEQVKPLSPKPSDGAVFEAQGYANPLAAGVIVVGEKQIPIQYLDLEIVSRLLWSRAGESLSKAYALTSN